MPEGWLRAGSAILPAARALFSFVIGVGYFEPESKKIGVARLESVQNGLGHVVGADHVLGLCSPGEISRAQAAVEC